MTGAGAAALLPLRFAASVVTSGARTAGFILAHTFRPGPPPPAAFVRIAFPPMSATGASLLAAMITLTPGTTVVDIDLAARRMVLHLLDASAAESSAAAIEREFMPGVLALFGEEP